LCRREKYWILVYIVSSMLILELKVLLLYFFAGVSRASHIAIILLQLGSIGLVRWETMPCPYDILSLVRNDLLLLLLDIVYMGRDEGPNAGFLRLFGKREEHTVYIVWVVVFLWVLLNTHGLATEREDVCVSVCWGIERMGREVESPLIARSCRMKDPCCSKTPPPVWFCFCKKGFVKKRRLRRWSKLPVRQFNSQPKNSLVCLYSFHSTRTFQVFFRDLLAFVLFSSSSSSSLSTSYFSCGVLFGHPGHLGHSYMLANKSNYVGCTGA